MLELPTILKSRIHCRVTMRAVEAAEELGQVEGLLTEEEAMGLGLEILEGRLRLLDYVRIQTSGFFASLLGAQ